MDNSIFFLPTYFIRFITADIATWSVPSRPAVISNFGLAVFSPCLSFEAPISTIGSWQFLSPHFGI